MACNMKHIIGIILTNLSHNSSTALERSVINNRCVWGVGLKLVKTCEVNNIHFQLNGIHSAF